MISIKRLFQTKMAKFLSIFFALLLIITNTGLLIFASIEYNQLTSRQTNSMVELVRHLMNDEEIESVTTYLEHYHHTHGVDIILLDNNDQVLYASVDQISTSVAHQIYNDEFQPIAKIYIDFTSFIIGKEFTTGIIWFNGLSILVYLIGLFVLLKYLNIQYKHLEEDFSKLGFDHASFYFSNLSSLNQRLIGSIRYEEDMKKLQANAVRILAHDVKTPLTVMKTYLLGLKSNRLTYEPAIITDLLGEVEKMEEVIPQLVSLNLDELPKQIDMKNIVEEVLNAMKEVLITKKIKIHQELSSYEMIASVSDIKRVVEHLIYNAFYYSDAFQTIHIKLSNEQRIFEVSNHGIYMSEETIERIKKGPYRAQAATILHQKGSGMGLQIVQYILQKWHASIDFTSEQHQLTTVTVTFPESMNII